MHAFFGVAFQFLAFQTNVLGAKILILKERREIKQPLNKDSSISIAHQCRLLGLVSSSFYYSIYSGFRSSRFAVNLMGSLYPYRSSCPSSEIPVRYGGPLCFP